MQNRIIFSSYLVALVLLGGIFLVGSTYGIPFEKMTGDPAYHRGFHPLTGFLSYVGILLWCTTSAITIFTASVLYRRGVNGVTPVYLTYAGVLTGILMVDDLFMLHDYLIGHLPMYILYALLTGYFFYRYFHRIRQDTFLLLLAAVGFLAVSVAMDLFLPNEGLEYFLEDGFKFLGIMSWALFFVIAARDALQEELSRN